MKRWKKEEGNSNAEAAESAENAEEEGRESPSAGLRAGNRWFTMCDSTGIVPLSIVIYMVYYSNEGGAFERSGIRMGRGAAAGRRLVTVISKRGAVSGERAGGLTWYPRTGIIP